MECKHCGANVGSEYRLCPYCGSELEYPKAEKEQPTVFVQNIYNGAPNQHSAPNQYANNQSCNMNVTLKSNKDKMLTLILCIVLGYLGIHCFYVGKTGMGILYLLTGGLFCVGWIIDIIRIVTGTYKDANGLPIL